MPRKKSEKTVEDEMLQNPNGVNPSADPAFSDGDAPDMADNPVNLEEFIIGEGGLLPDGDTGAAGEPGEKVTEPPDSEADPPTASGDANHAEEPTSANFSSDRDADTDFTVEEPAKRDPRAEEPTEPGPPMEESTKAVLSAEESKEGLSGEPKSKANHLGEEITGPGDVLSGPEPEKPKLTPAQARKRAFYDLDIRGLDRDLSPEEQQEWSAIYASYRSKSVLTGTVIGADQNTFDVMNRETGESETKTLSSLIIIDYRVKVLIPESEMWMPGEERPGFVLRNMVGSEIDYVILEVDREGECAIGSRRMALAAKRHFFATARGGHKEGDLLKCRVLATGPHRCSVECGGYDIQLTTRDLSYTAIADLREKFHPGQELDCRLKLYDREAGSLIISVKEAKPNPFIGADKRHPIGSRRQAVISGKYRGGVFCTLPDDTVCLCLYSAQHSDMDFAIGDSVIVAIRQYDYDRQLIYGRILAKW